MRHAYSTCETVESELEEAHVQRCMWQYQLQLLRSAVQCRAFEAAARCTSHCNSQPIVVWIQVRRWVCAEPSAQRNQIREAPGHVRGADERRQHEARVPHP